MNIIIDAACDAIPNEARELPSQGDPLLTMLSCLHYNSDNPPLAELLAQYYQLEGDWLILSPSHWQASHNNVIIAAFGADLELEEAELKEQFHRFSEHLMAIGMALYYHNSSTWLISTNHKSLLKAKPISQMVNRPLILELAQIDETMHWQKFLTESQMFFASNHDNSPINGVWLWGGGALEDKKTVRIGTNQQFLSLAQLCSSQVSLYEANHSLKEYDLLLLSDISELNKVHQEQLQKRVTRWYWNNAAYECSPVSWYTKIWRTLFHAHKTTPIT